MAKNVNEKLAILVQDLKLADFVGLCMNEQGKLIKDTAELLESKLLTIPARKPLITALEQIGSCQRLSNAIREEARRIVESWVPF